MRFLMLAAALAITAPPALGQVRPELPEWAREWNAPDRPRPGLTPTISPGTNRGTTERKCAGSRS